MKSKNIIPLLVLIIVATGNLLLYAYKKNDLSDWKLEWKEDFNGKHLNTKYWGIMNRQSDQSRKYHSPNPACYEFQKGHIIIKGIQNTDVQTDTARYLTGAITTKDKKRFSPPCRIEVRAKINSTTGAWPAIWMLPFEKEKGWPDDGEIDIMEHYNHDDKFDQVVHTSFTKKTPNANPTRYISTIFDKEAFNIFGVDILKDAVIFHLNGKATLRYPRVDSLSYKNQFPFMRDWYLMIDMQLGSDYPTLKTIDNNELPVSMEIDWVKYYKKK